MMHPTPPKKKELFVASCRCSPFGLLPGADMNGLLGPFELVPLCRPTVVVEQHHIEIVRELLHPSVFIQFTANHQKQTRMEAISQVTYNFLQCYLVNCRIDIDSLVVTHCQRHKVFASGGVLLIASTPATQVQFL